MVMTRTQVREFHKFIQRHILIQICIQIHAKGKLILMSISVCNNFTCRIYTLHKLNYFLKYAISLHLTGEEVRDMKSWRSSWSQTTTICLELIMHHASSPLSCDTSNCIYTESQFPRGTWSCMSPWAPWQKASIGCFTKQKKCYYIDLCRKASKSNQIIDSIQVPVAWLWWFL